VPGLWKRQIDFLALPLEELVRHLEKNARTIACVLLRAARASMLQIQKDPNCLLNNAMRLVAFQINDKAHTTGVALVARIVKTLFSRRFYLFLPQISVFKM